MSERDKDHIDCAIVCGRCGSQILARGYVDSEPVSATGKDLIIHLEVTEEMEERRMILCKECITTTRIAKENSEMARRAPHVDLF